MLAGNPYVRNNTNTVESQGITWAWSVSFLCTSTITDSRVAISIADQPNPTTPNIDDVQCPWGLRAQIHFPSCWDGVNLDSANHMSHTAYPVGNDNGPCPTSHPVRIIGIFYEVWFNVVPFNKLNDGGRFVLANGDPTGYGLHADFMNGWDNSVLSRAVATCTSDTGNFEACPVFANEGRIISGDEANACTATNPFPQEVTGPGTLLQNLPGCVAVTEGPAPAELGKLVPGCVPGSSSGSGSMNGISSVSLASSSLSSNPSKSTSVGPLGTSGVSLASDPSAPKSSSSTPAVPLGDSVASHSSSSKSPQSTPTDPLGASDVSLASDPSAPKSSNSTPAAPVGDSVASVTKSPKSTPAVSLGDSAESISSGQALSGHSSKDSSSTPVTSPSLTTPASSPTPTDPPSVENLHQPSAHSGGNDNTADENEGHHHHYCHDDSDTTSDSAHPTSSMIPHRRHHVKRGHGSPMLF